MISQDSRQQPRRQFERRTTERRTLAYKFLSPQWLEQIQKENILWPKHDRRNRDRRISLRRNKASRRVKDDLSKRIPHIIATQSDLLTPGERQMLIDLMNQSISD